jgi:hypothetical protein
MIRENEEYRILAVSKTQLKVLATGGAYTNKPDCLTRTMPDGKLEIVMLRSVIENMERLEAEVDAEANDLDESAPIELPELPTPPPAPKANIPQADLDAYEPMTRPPPVVGENNRPRDHSGSNGFGGNRIDIGKLFGG